MIYCRTVISITELTICFRTVQVQSSSKWHQNKAIIIQGAWNIGSMLYFEVKKIHKTVQGIHLTLDNIDIDIQVTKKKRWISNCALTITFWNCFIFLKMAGVLFEDIFNVKDIDPEGKKFDRGKSLYLI